MSEQLITEVQHVISCVTRVTGGWCHAAFTRSRWRLVDGRRASRTSSGGRYTARWASTASNGAHAELGGICAMLQAVRDGESALVYVSPEALPHVSGAIANSSLVELPAAVDHKTVRSALQRLSVVAYGDSMYRYPLQRDQCETLLTSALASGEEIPALEAVAAAIRQGVASGGGVPVSVLGQAGYTTDFSMVERPVCAIVRTSAQGQPVGTVHIVRLPETCRDSQWGETSAVLLAFLHARHAGFGQAAFYTDGAGVIRHLHDLAHLRRHNPPEPLRSLLGHPVIRRVHGINAHWIPRASTPAQITADHTARHASAPRTLLSGTSELPLEAFLSTLGH